MFAHTQAWQPFLACPNKHRSATASALLLSRPTRRACVGMRSLELVGAATAECYIETASVLLLGPEERAARHLFRDDLAAIFVRALHLLACQMSLADRRALMDRHIGSWLLHCRVCGAISATPMHSVDEYLRRCLMMSFVHPSPRL